ncbi:MULTISPECIES: response regulator transcription factor [Streptomyces]|uniref:Response regulator transcription factor n=1 Tax=Streptomyces lonegramiae TaxID=3075524 RepID=A0ABU2XN82_9ACTN|nr:response regulator transcription factor [Streptomyces sp. DSM 41529]MDT0547287.1 response regulator transcription factor [Streptomyces sp. DSM 41529]
MTAAGGPQWRVLLVDDHPLFREGLAAAVNLDEAFAVVGQAASAEEAVTEAARTEPDLVVMDLGLPGRSGTEATRRILCAHPDARVVVMTMSEDDDSLLAAMRAGARGYLLKGAGRDEILRALHTVARGGAVFSPRMAERLGSLLGSFGTASAKEAFPTLTAREREVLELLAVGLGYRQIAQRLVVTDKTVRNHVGSIFAKLQVRDRAQAIVRAREAGLGGE